MTDVFNKFNNKIMPNKTIIVILIFKLIWLYYNNIFFLRNFITQFENLKHYLNVYIHNVIYST